MPVPVIEQGSLAQPVASLFCVSSVNAGLQSVSSLIVPTELPRDRATGNPLINLERISFGCTFIVACVWTDSGLSVLTERSCASVQSRPSAEETGKVACQSPSPVTMPNTRKYYPPAPDVVSATIRGTPISQAFIGRDIASDCFVVCQKEGESMRSDVIDFSNSETKHKRK